MRRLIWAAGLVLVGGAALWLRLWLSPLDVSAPRTTLRVGETVQLAVSSSTWLGTQPLLHPERTKYITNWESIAVVEPDGKITGVGTWGAATETTNVMAYNGNLRGSARFVVRAEGPGPSLDFRVEAPPVEDMPTAACCSTPVRLYEGQQLAFRVVRRSSPQDDVTRRGTGTRYTLFFGSGVPNDPRPGQIIGYGEGINPATFRVDDQHGVIVAPLSIGRLRYFTVLVFARNGEAVGWKQFQLAHSGGDSVPQP